MHGLSGHNAGEPLGPFVVGRHLDRRPDERRRRVAFADAHESVVAMDEDQDVLIAAFEADVVGLRVAQANDFHPLDPHRHRVNARRA